MLTKRGTLDESKKRTQNRTYLSSDNLPQTLLGFLGYSHSKSSRQIFLHNWNKLLLYFVLSITFVQVSCSKTTVDKKYNTKLGLEQNILSTKKKLFWLHDSLKWLAYITSHKLEISKCTFKWKLKKKMKKTAGLLVSCEDEWKKTILVFQGISTL